MWLNNTDISPTIDQYSADILTSMTEGKCYYEFLSCVFFIVVTGEIHMSKQFAG